MNPQQRPLRPYIIRVVVALLLLGVGYYVYSHGRIDASQSKPQEITLVKQSSGLDTIPEFKSGSSHLLSSGTYSIAAPIRDGGLVVQQLTVPHFLQSVSVQNTGYSSYTKTVARNANENIAVVNGSVQSFDIGGNFRKPITNNISNDSYTRSVDQSFPDFEYFRQLSKDMVAGFVVSSNGQQPAVYNLSKKSVTYFPLIESRGRYVSISPDYGTFSALDSRQRELHMYDIRTGSEQLFKLGGELEISSIGSRALFSSRGDNVAIVGGRSFEDTNDANRSIDGGDQVVYVFDSSSGIELFSKSFGSTVVTGVVLSPSGNMITIQGLDQTGVYDVDSGDLLFSLPFASNSIYWFEDTQFIAQTPENGLFQVNSSGKSAKTITPYTSVRPSKVSFIEDGSIYFTGFAQSIRGVANANIYTSDLSKDSSNQNSNTLTKFPYQGEGCYVDVLDDTPVVQLTRYKSPGSVIIDQRAKQDAISYVRENLGDDVAKRIIYTYIDFNY